MQCDNPNASLATPFSNFVFEDILMHATGILFVPCCPLPLPLSPSHFLRPSSAANPIGDFTGGTIPIEGVILRNITIIGPDLKHKGVPMMCTNVSGSSSQIVPPEAVCSELRLQVNSQELPTTSSPA